uniref:ArgK protein n=1 Tax=Chlorobium chlorochromatii (strain CaD3) TaxID=340177 RepID=Q3AR77_CHLCH
MPHHHTFDVEAIANAIMQGNRHQLSRAITLVESQRIEHHHVAEAILERCMASNRHALRIGITGSPGAGKSTFIEAFGEHILSQGLRLAVLAIDPSSHHSKGSILGDKARMEKLSGRKEAFIRPTPSSGHLGGTSPRTHEALLLCEAAGYDVIIVETVGVGQSELHIEQMVDFVLLLMLPGSGDELQGIKRGIMEIADMIAITKCDGLQATSAAISHAEFEAALRMVPKRHPFWQPSVQLTSAVTGVGIAEVWQQIERFFAIMQQENSLETQRREQRRHLLANVLEEQLRRLFFNHPTIRQQQPHLVQQVLDGTLSPFTAATRLIELFRHNPIGEKQ